MTEADRSPVRAAQRPARSRAAALEQIRRREHDSMRLALDAFDCGLALVDLTHRRLQWCSPAFSTHCCVQADDALAALEPRLPGVTAALVRLVRGAQARLAWPAALAGGLQAQATLVRPGLAALRLMAPEEPGAPAAGAGEAVQAPVAAPTHRATPSAEDEQAEAARRHLEDRERLLFTSRALSVGEMASTLAHELNQPIGTVANVLRGLRMRLQRPAPADGGDLLAGLQLALDQALFASRIIARIREYTQARGPRLQRLELGTVLRESLSLLDWEVRRDGIDVQLDLVPQPCPVQGDEVMLQQLFVNLMRNAIEAMRDNPPDAAGRVQRRLLLRLRIERGGREAVLRLRDNGCGLPSDDAAQLFVPFQSSKPNGMGIGLNICRSFAELHQGRLWFSRNESPDGAPERGCSFHVALPLLAPAAAGDPPSLLSPWSTT
ncbi:sensor histidine kinase [Aquincola sp. J276]|uniref:sensor histidine kinase n=1 Tax=Aquincola sp. J276 TaxID=2898432 RepID=UPI002151DFA5|nr:ATP-binding protein [Aquincola sp. J276]MCR5867128.1 ATP-binding protein [Aquincola sp. J276]